MQAKDKSSLKVQEKLLKWGQRNICRCIYCRKAKQPELARLLGKLQYGDKLIVTNLDRTARNIKRE